MAQKSHRGKRRGPASNGSRPANPATPDRYQKFLPEWMRGDGIPAPPRPPRQRRFRPARSAGGYTPGKFGQGDPLA